MFPNDEFTFIKDEFIICPSQLSIFKIGFWERLEKCSITVDHISNEEEYISIKCELELRNLELEIFKTEFLKTLKGVF